MNWSASSVSFAWLAACWAPDWTWVAGGSRGGPGDQLAGAEPRVGGEEDDVELALLAGSCWAVGTVNTAMVAPPRELTDPNFAIPEIVNCRVGPLAETPIRLADRVAVLVRGALVDHDLVVAPSQSGRR